MGKEDVQPATQRCECGRTYKFHQRDPHAFDWRCECGRAGVLCWDEDDPAPVFERHPQQSSLWA